MTAARHVAATVLLIGGVGLQVLAVVGLSSMRNALDRLHYVGLAGFGALLVGASIIVRESFSLIGDKALGAGLLLVFLGPVVVHTTARSFLDRTRGDWRRAVDGDGEDRA